MHSNLPDQAKTSTLELASKSMPALSPYKPSPIWRKNRLVARILLRKQNGRVSDRDIRLARQFKNDPEILDRLLDQAIHSLRAPCPS
jgi:hypothetical protein